MLRDLKPLAASRILYLYFNFLNFVSGFDSEHPRGDLQRRHGGALFFEAHPEKAVHRHRQKISHSPRLKGRD